MTNFCNTDKDRMNSESSKKYSKNKIKKSTSTEKPTESDDTNNFHSLDSRPLKQAKSKFFMNSLKISCSAKIQSKAQDKDATKKKWNPNVKIEKKERKNKIIETPRTERLDRNFVYLNVLQKSYKTITPKKTLKKEVQYSSKNATPSSNNQKGTIPDILSSDLFQDLNKNNQNNFSSLRDSNNRERGSICLNNVIVEDKNNKLLDEIKDFSPKEVGISASSKEIEENPLQNDVKEEQDTSNKTDSKKTEGNVERSTKHDSIKIDLSDIKNEEEDPKIFRHNKIMDILQNNSINSGDESLDDSNMNNNSPLNDSCENKKKLPKSMVKDIFEKRKRKNKKTETQIVEESLNNMFVTKLMSNNRSNSRGEMPKQNKPEDDIEEKKMTEFMKNRREMANICKINIINYDEKKKENPSTFNEDEESNILNRQSLIKETEARKKTLSDEEYLALMENELNLK